MMAYCIICLVALLGAGLTLFSGFGLGTLLTPVFGLFFSIELAITLTAIVHFLNNIFKLKLLGKNAHWPTIIKFGIPSVIAAFIGAYLLQHLTNLQPIYSYTLYNHTLFITPIKVIIACVVFVFTLFDLIPKFADLQINKKYISLGGLLSGFFGGLSGNQGALRTAFLVKLNLSKESFIATGVVIACFIDISRLCVYLKNDITLNANLDYTLITLATLSAFIGTYIGSNLLKKVTIKTIQIITATLLILFSVLLGSGII